MDYDLSRLNWRSFEQLVQGIGSEVLGPGLVIFGDGPDGGREATVNAVLPYPTEAESWSGYTVVQAKFLQRPKNTTADGKWAVEQLEAELSAYQGEEARELPDNMIFATNVTLSPSKEVGAKDKIFSVAKEAGLDHFDVWDYDKVRVYLDKYTELRRSFAPYVLAGDVLAEMMEMLEGIKEQRPDFDEVMSRFLQKELLADQWVNLEQAGRSTEEQVPVSRVFVDLPVSELRIADPPVEDPQELEPGFVAQVLETAGMRLDPESLHPQHGAQEGEEAHSLPQEARLVLVGGPGQGKTTIGQFVCQMFRASLLRSRNQQTLAPEVKDALSTLESHCGSAGLDLPEVRRFPVRIELTKFADELGDADGCNSMLSYIAKLISARVDEEISSPLMARWLASYPWLLILDGLDEVPASGNRSQMMEAIREFWVDVAGATADCLVIATTRPQGYEDEFSPKFYRHLYLTPLSTARALHYAERLLRARFGTDADRRTEISSRLTRAAGRADTRRLMTSPLQVTIMATLLERMGQPPEGRWNLFSQYYRVIYDRELEREISAAWILRDHRPDIDAIHKRIGLLLQAEGENASQAEAQISRARFSEVVKARLQEEELDDDEDLVQQIMDAAMDRLVFLVPVEAENVGFEIRSLQEFMAAEALLEGKEKIVERRLRKIAPLSAWRNVFLFAAGRCFTDLQHYRDTINTICGELNDTTIHSLAPLALPGSRLAIDLLEDGVANRQTRYERLLGREALRLARRAPGELSDRLAEVYQASLRPTYETELREAISVEPFFDSLGAWRTLAVLQARGENWARGILEDHLPPDDALGDLLASLPRLAKSDWLSQVLGKICGSAPPEQSLPFHATLEDLDVARGAPAWYQVFANLTAASVAELSEVKLQFEEEPVETFSIGIRMIDSLSAPLREAVELLDVHDREQAPSSWDLLFSDIEFLQSPTSEKLAEILERFDGREEIISKTQAHYTGWPLSSLLLSVSSGLDRCGELARLARDGAFGSTEQWIAAQERWKEHGVREADLPSPSDSVLPYDAEVAVRGFPLNAATITVTESRRRPAATVLTWLDQIEHPETRQFTTGVLFWMLHGFEGEKVSSDLSFGQLAARVNAEDVRGQRVLPLRALNAFSWSENLAEHEVNLLNELGTVFEEVDTEEVISEELLHTLVAHLQHEERLGLLRLLVIGLSYVPEETEQVEAFLHANLGERMAPARALLSLKLDREPCKSDFEALASGAEAWILDAVGAVRAIQVVELRERALRLLAEALPPEQWSAKHDLASMAASFIGRQPSGLATAQVWDELELFRQGSE